VARLHKMMEKYQGKVNFLTVYISEAHATDEWPLGNLVKIPQHKSLDDRITAALMFQKENQYQPPLVVDTMDNSFNSCYAAWPERGYIIYDGELAYISRADTSGAIDWEDGVESWLEKHCPLNGVS